MPSPDPTARKPTRRHPSAGNLGTRPRAVREERDSPRVTQTPTQAFWTAGPTPTGRLRVGPDLDDDALARLIGQVEGKRVVELGCIAPLSVELARRGAKVIAVDPSTERLAAVREAADAAEVRVELHQGDLAELPFVRADQVDLVVSVYALGEVEDLGRVLRQAHRVLRSESALLVTIPHPMSWMTQVETDGALRLVRTAFDRAPVRWQVGASEGTVKPHQLSDVFIAMSRAGFRVDTLLEPRPVRPGPAGSPTWSAQAEWVPTTAVIRGRKQGV